VHRGNLPSPPSKRRSRFERTKPNNFWWQDRDEEIIAAVYLHGVLSTKQIADLFFGGSVSAATKRLRKLFDAGWLQRAFRPNGVGAPEALYLVERRQETVHCIADRLGWAEERVRRYWFPTQMLTDHFLEVNAFRVTIEISCRRNGVLLELWEDERFCVDRIRDDGGKVKVFAPDAYFRFFKDGTLWAYFLEWDRGTESVGRIRQKAENYATYWRKGFYTDRYGLRGFRVLWVTKEERMDELMGATEKVEGAPPFWWATRDVVQECKDILTEPIWTVKGERRALLS
jgi:hypothetical protein